MLVNNAGLAVWKSLETTTIAEWDRTFPVNVRAAARLSAAVLPGMQARRFGRIINIGSEAGVAIVPRLAAYCASEHALRALTEVIQDGNHDNGIKACVVCSGFVDTDIGQVGLIEVIRERLHLPCRISRDLSAKVRDGTVYVRHGSHVAIADQTEITDLEEEARRAATQ